MIMVVPNLDTNQQGRDNMTTNLGACEFEDSTNCIWNAQEQGNGIGESFIDIDGATFYIEAPFTCPENKVPGWLDENGVPQGCVDNNPNPLQPKEEMVVPEAPEIAVPEPIESVGVTPTPPEYIDAGVGELAETGAVDTITGLLLGVALVASGVVLFIKSKKTQTV